MRAPLCIVITVFFGCNGVSEAVPRPAVSDALPLSDSGSQHRLALGANAEDAHVARLTAMVQTAQAAEIQMMSSIP
jgi:hypothetical protein